MEEQSREFGEQTSAVCNSNLRSNGTAEGSFDHWKLTLKMSHGKYGASIRGMNLSAEVVHTDFTIHRRLFLPQAILDTT